MPRSVSAPTLSAVAAVFTQPMYFLALHFSPVLRYSTLGERNWSGYQWAGTGAQIESLSDDNGHMSGVISVPNADLSFGALVLSQGARGKACEIWAADASALDTADPVQIFSGYMDAAEIGMRVTIEIVSDRWEAAFLPRVVCAPPIFNHLPASGTLLKWGGDTYELRRG